MIAQSCWVQGWCSISQSAICKRAEIAQGARTNVSECCWLCQQCGQVQICSGLMLGIDGHSRPLRRRRW